MLSMKGLCFVFRFFYDSQQLHFLVYLGTFFVFRMEGLCAFIVCLGVYRLTLESLELEV